MKVNTQRSKYVDVALKAYMGLFLAFLQAPLIILIVTSVNGGSVVTFPPTSFSLKWYPSLWAYLEEAPGVKPGLGSSIVTSLWLAFTAMVGATIAGVGAALVVERRQFPGKALLRQLFLMPVIFPQLVTGVGLLVWFSAIGGVPISIRLLIGHLILTLPYVVLTVSASLQMFDERIDEAAMSLGATRIQTFWYVTLPNIRSGIISGAIFAWLVSMSNFTISYFLFSGEKRPLPIWLFNLIQYYIDPSIAALSAVIVTLTLIVLVIINRLSALGRLLGLR